MRGSNNRHLPAEIMEEILLKLPVKSLLRFSSVSKSWNSTIFGSRFVKRYRGPERIALFRRAGVTIIGKASSCLISSISSNNPVVDTTPFFCPFSKSQHRGRYRYTLEASCGEMWLARVEGSLFLWNPSMRKYKELPLPSLLQEKVSSIVFGLGYDCVGDDYKILKITYANDYSMVELYSLRSDSWKSIEPNLRIDVIRKCTSRCGVFVGGKLHFKSCLGVIISFDLWKEEFGEVAPPRYWLTQDRMELSVLRGMLCVTLNYEKWCDIWVMEEYGVAKSWTNKFTIQYCINPFATLRVDQFILPLYLDENVGEIIACFNNGKNGKMFMYRIEDGEKSRPPQEVLTTSHRINGGFLYVDSLVEPVTWSTMLV